MYKYFITLLALVLLYACDDIQRVRISGNTNQVSSGVMRCSNPHLEQFIVYECYHDQNADGEPCGRDRIIKNEVDTASCDFDGTAPEGSGLCDIYADPMERGSIIQTAYKTTVDCVSAETVVFRHLINIYAGCLAGECILVEDPIVACVTESRPSPIDVLVAGPQQRGLKALIGCPE